IFISYSRGSWGGAVFSLGLMTISAYVTSSTQRTRRRIVLMAGLCLGLSAVALLGILSDKETRGFFLQRAALTQDYDEGVTGRFGNQLRSLPMLLERPAGFGPLRFRLLFAPAP